MRSIVLAALVAASVLGCSARDRRDEPVRATALSVPRVLASRLAHAQPLLRDGASFVGSGPGLRVRVPGRVTAATHLETSPLVWLDVSPEDLRDVEGVMDGGALLYADVRPDTDVVASFDGVTAEEYRILRSTLAGTTFSWRLRLGPALAKVSLTNGFVQAFDGEGRARLRAEPLVAWDGEGRERALDARIVSLGPNEARLIARLDTRGLAYPIVVDPAWGLTSKMAQGRYDTRPVRLTSGKVFVAGGRNSTGGFLSTVETFDPATLTWTLQAPMKTPRSLFGSPAVMSDGRVMVAGGNGSSYSSACEIWDPTTNTWPTRRRCRPPCGRTEPSR